MCCSEVNNVWDSVKSVASGCEMLLREENETSWSARGSGAVLDEEALLVSGVDLN